MSDSTVPVSVDTVLDRVRSHRLHPLGDDDFTIDRNRREHGIADVDDEDWKVRLLAVRDLVRVESESIPDIVDGLSDDDLHVRQVCAKALGVRAANDAIAELQQVARDDPEAVVRSQAILALGQIGADDTHSLLRDRAESDPSKDVRHRAELAIDRIEKDEVVSDATAEAYRDLDPETFRTVTVGDPAPAFELSDTDGNRWALSDRVEANEWTVLLWVFADWCPVCHREFDELIKLREAFEARDVSVATVECHDRYRCRVMVGEELEPDYWFAEESFQDRYTDRIWWPHLIDRAGAVGAIYGVDPMAYAVHAEYINRPATVIVDPDGIVRFAYYGTFWGDRPSIEEVLEMIRSEDFEYEHPDRLSAA